MALACSEDNVCSTPPKQSFHNLEFPSSKPASAMKQNTHSDIEIPLQRVKQRCFMALDITVHYNLSKGYGTFGNPKDKSGCTRDLKGKDK